MNPPKRPDFFDGKEPIVEAPDHWRGGEVVHTGGNVWLRKWDRELPDGRSIEVAYDHFREGLKVNSFREDDSFESSTGGFALHSPHMDADEHSDYGYACAARRLMHTINIAVGDQK